MTGINLRVATLKNAKLKNCNLRGATLAGTDLEVGYLSFFTHKYIHGGKKVVICGMWSLFSSCRVKQNEGKLEQSSVSAQLTLIIIFLSPLFRIVICQAVTSRKPT